MKWFSAFFLVLAALAFSTADGAAQQADAPAGLRMIIVRTEAEAGGLLNRLRGGEQFDLLARTQSIDPSGRSGGYLGVLAMEQLRPEFQAVLKGLTPGDVSPVAKIGNSYALLQLLTAEETFAIELKSWIDGGREPQTTAIERLWTIAIGSGESSLLQKALEAGINVNTIFLDGSTPLMGAAQAGQIDKVRALLAAGASANAQTRDGTTALLLAAQSGRTEIVRALIDAGADVNARAKTGVTPLIDASFGGHLETVRALLEKGADPNVTLGDGSTALMAASVKGQNEIVRALLKAGAQVNAGIDSGGTALMEAAYSGQVETARILLAAGADPKATGSGGLTALMGAAFKGSAGTVQVLLDAGAPVTPRDKKGWTALTYARASANPDTVRLLLSKTTDIAPLERSLALGGTYINEYYSSNEDRLLEMAAAEFQKALSIQPQNAAALEWMGAVEYLRWSRPPTLEQYRKAYALLKQSVDLDPQDPDRHCWIAATSSILVSAAKGTPAAEVEAITEDGIQHARKAIELDPRMASAYDNLLYMHVQARDKEKALRLLVRYYAILPPESEKARQVMADITTLRRMK